MFDVEFYAFGDDDQPAEKFILGLTDEDAGRLFGFVDNIASDWPLRRSEGTDWKPLTRSFPRASIGALAVSEAIT